MVTLSASPVCSASYRWLSVSGATKKKFAWKKRDERWAYVISSLYTIFAPDPDFLSKALYVTLYVWLLAYSSLAIEAPTTIFFHWIFDKIIESFSGPSIKHWMELTWQGPLSLNLECTSWAITKRFHHRPSSEIAFSCGAQIPATVSCFPSPISSNPID